MTMMYFYEISTAVYDDYWPSHFIDKHHVSEDLFTHIYHIIDFDGQEISETLFNNSVTSRIKVIRGALKK